MINSNYMRFFMIALAVMAGFSAFGQQQRRVVVPTTDTITNGVQKCSETIFQTAHGFSKGEAIYHNGTSFVSMLGLYGDNQEPHYLVVDSINANMFIGAACGIYYDTLGLAPGLYFWTDTGLQLSPDTVEFPIAKVYNGKTQVMGLPGFEFNATGKPLLEVPTVSGQRTLKGGQVIPLFCDSIAYVDTICGTPVDNLTEALLALEACVPEIDLDSLMKSESASGLGNAGRITYVGSGGKLKDDADLEYDETNQRVRVSAANIGTATTASTKNFIFRNTSLGVIGTAQYPPTLEFEGNVYCTTPAASVVAKSFLSFSYSNGTTQGVPTFTVIAPSPIAAPGNYQNLIQIRSGTSNGYSGSINLGSFNTVSANGISIGGSNSVTGTGNPIAVGFESTASNGGHVFGTYSSSSHTDAIMVGRLLVSSASSTQLFGMGIGVSERATIAAGTGLVNTSAIPQLRVLGLGSASSPTWTASGDTITFASSLTLNINEGIELIGASYSFRTITEVISGTRIRVNAAPTNSSGSLVRFQQSDVLQIGNGTESYNKHLVVNRNGLIGLGVTSPTAKVHIQAGTGLVAPIRFSNGVQLTTPQSLTLEPATGGATLLFTDQGGTRRTLAYTSDIPATNLTLTGTNSVIELTNSNGTDIVYKTTGSNVSLTKVSGTKDTLYIGTVEHWGEVFVSGGSTSVTTGTPERPDNDTPGTATANVSSEYTQSGSAINYIGASGQAEITGSVSFQPTTGGDYAISVFKEGTEVASTKVAVSVAAGKYETVSLPRVNVTVSTNDTFDVRVEPLSGTDTITVYRYTVYSRKIY